MTYVFRYVPRQSIAEIYRSTATSFHRYPHAPIGQQLVVAYKYCSTVQNKSVSYIHVQYSSFTGAWPCNYTILLYRYCTVVQYPECKPWMKKKCDCDCVRYYGGHHEPVDSFFLNKSSFIVSHFSTSHGT